MIQLERNYSRENMRGKDQPAFEWWTAELKYVNVHVHNRKGLDNWTWIIRGVTESAKSGYVNKEAAFATAMMRLSAWISQTFEAPQPSEQVPGAATLDCLGCSGRFPVNEMYTVDACSEMCQEKVTKQVPDDTGGGEKLKVEPTCQHGVLMSLSCEQCVKMLHGMHAYRPQPRVG